MRATVAATALLAALTLSACGTSTSDRAISGGAIGAGVGAGAGLLLGGVGVGTGAVVGGAVGAGVGALTEPDQVNLGRPAWK